MPLENVAPESGSCKDVLEIPGSIIPSQNPQDDSQDRALPVAPHNNRLRRLLECGEYPWPLSLEVFERSQGRNSSESQDDASNSNADGENVVEEPPRPLEPIHRTNGSTWPLDMPHHVFAGRPEPPDALTIRRPDAARLSPRISTNSLTRPLPALIRGNSENDVAELLESSEPQRHHQLPRIQPGPPVLFLPTFAPIQNDEIINCQYHFWASQLPQQIHEAPHAMTPICGPNMQIDVSSGSRRSNSRRQRPVRFEQTFMYHNGR